MMVVMVLATMVLAMFAAVVTAFRMPAVAPVAAAAPEEASGGGQQRGGAKKYENRFHVPHSAPT